MKRKRKIIHHDEDLLNNYYGKPHKKHTSGHHSYSQNDSGALGDYGKLNHSYNYNEILSDYYGMGKRPKISKTASFDDGQEILLPSGRTGQPADDEYIVLASSLPGEFEEEYVVEQSTLPGELEEEYVVDAAYAQSDDIAAINGEEEYVLQASIAHDDYNTINSTAYYSEDIPTDQLIDRTQADQSYQTSVLSPFSQPNSMHEMFEYMEPEAEMVRPQSVTSLAMETPYEAAARDPFADDKGFNQFEAPARSDKGKAESAKEEELINDLQAILSGQKVYDSKSGKTVDRSELDTQQSVDRPQAPTQPPGEAPHAIFDRIKENMQYANAYNLGSIPLDTQQLENRFNELDALSKVEKRMSQEKKTAAQAFSSGLSNSAPSVPKVTKPNGKLSSQLDFDPAEFLQDLESIQKQSDVVATNPPPTTATQFDIDVHSADYPARPTIIRPYTTKEKLQIFGKFEYEPDPSTFDGDGIKVLNNWRESNIVSVDISQLNGKKFGKQVIKNGNISFNKNGADQLKRLWAAWEAAGLLDKIMTFEGGYAARYIRGTQSRSPRPLSNHAWGTAFDINASWNGFGKQPALVGQTGCVRELVSIANNNGFFWGGHFNGNKDGMHFELGKVL